MSLEPLFFEDLSAGQSWRSPARQIRAEDVACFAALTGDHDPLHRKGESEPAAGLPFGQPVAHGLLGLSVLAGLSSEHPAVRTLALVQILEWDFLRPVFFGDTVYVMTRVVQARRHGTRAGRVTWERSLLNQNDHVVQRGRLITLVAARERLPRTKPATVAPGRLNESTLAQPPSPAPQVFFERVAVGSPGSDRSTVPPTKR
jgi:3-hydroxybutyryl-CoA dehydratase